MFALVRVVDSFSPVWYDLNMVSRVAGAAKRSRACPQCGATHRTYGTRYCNPCYKAREREKAHARGVKKATPVPKIELGDKYGAWITVEEPPVREGGEQWGTKKQTWTCVCEGCGEERVHTARYLGKLPQCPICRRREKKDARSILEKSHREEVEDRKAARDKEREDRRVEIRARIEEARRRRAASALRRSKHPLYSTWQGIRRRCLNPKSTNYTNYGGRGIAVCVEWAKDFGAFRDYCEEHLGPKPEGCSIDRTDNEGHYEPGNIRWSTPKEQAWNTRSNIRITIGGVTKKFLEWVEEYGLDEKEATLTRARLAHGWDSESAFTEEKGLRIGRRDGGLLTEEQIEEVEARGFSPALVTDRVYRGWPLEKAMTAPKGTVHMKVVECWFCGEFGHIASSHPEYEEWLEEKLRKPPSIRDLIR